MHMFLEEINFEGNPLLKGRLVATVSHSCLIKDSLYVSFGTIPALSSFLLLQFQHQDILLDPWNSREKFHAVPVC